MSRRFCSRLVGVAIVSACGFSATNMAEPPTGNTDGGAPPPPDVFIPPPVVPCADLTFKQCVGDTGGGTFEQLRECKVVGEEPVDTVCPWRCVDDPMPRCRTLVPSGGAVTSTDLMPTTGLTAKQISGGLTQVAFDTTTGAIRIGGAIVRNGVTGIDAGIDFVVRNGVGIWRFQSLELGNIVVRALLHLPQHNKPLCNYLGHKQTFFQRFG